MMPCIARRRQPAFALSSFRGAELKSPCETPAEVETGSKFYDAKQQRALRAAVFSRREPSPPLPVSRDRAASRFFCCRNRYACAEPIRKKSMPNAQKELIVSDLRDLAQGSKGAILTDYRGLTVAEVTRLRTKLRESDAEYHIVKNTLYKVALGRETISPELDKLLTGPTAILFAKTDVVAPTKAILDFLRDLKKPDIKVKGGFIDGKIYSVDQVTALSKLPPREQIIATLIGTLDGPAANFVGTLDNIIGSFVRTIQAIADKVAESGPIAGSASASAAPVAEAPAETTAAPTAEAAPEPSETPAEAPTAKADPVETAPEATAAPTAEASPEPVAEAALESGETTAPETVSEVTLESGEAPAPEPAATAAPETPASAEPVSEVALESGEAAPTQAEATDAEKTSE